MPGRDSAPIPLPREAFPGPRADERRVTKGMERVPGSFQRRHAWNEVELLDECRVTHMTIPEPCGPR